MSSGRGPARRAQHLIRDVCHARGLDHTRALELDRVRAEVVEQTHTAPEQDRDDVQVQLVEKACPRALLHGADPITLTSRSPAAALAWSTALSMPSVT